MRGILRSCLLQLALWAAVSAGFYLYARSVGRSGDLLPAAAGIGLLLSMALLVAMSAVGTSLECRALSPARRAEGPSLQKAPPRDGAWTAVAGEIRCFSPVRGPISGEAVAAYEYTIERDQRVGRSTSVLTYFDGKALAPSVIATPHGDVRLLLVPDLQVEPAGVAYERALANARDYVRSTTFAKRDTARQRSSALEREWADDDGTFRIDKRYSAVDVDLGDGFRLEERHVEPGDPVCVFGVYSAARAGLIPDRRWGRRGRLMRGTPAELSRALRARVIRYAVVSLILASLAAAGARAYLG